MAMLAAGLMVASWLSVAAEPLHPMVFVGGVGASMLNADLNKTSSTHWYCATKSKDYPLWLYYSSMAPFKVNCWLDNMKLRWHDGKLQDFGVKTKLVGDGLRENVDISKGFAKDLWSDLLASVKDLGYSGTSPHVSALHYDWRMSLEQLIHDGTFEKMKKQIESRVADAKGKRAVLVSLSYGGPLLHKFLAKFVDDAWKQKHVERWISLSGVFGGSAELTRMAFYPEAKDFFNVPKLLPYVTYESCRDMANSFASSFTLRPAFLAEGETLVSVTTNGEHHNYTKSQVADALADSGLSDAREVYESSENAYSFDDLDAPGVEVDCFYGVDDRTVNSMHFGNGFNKQATSYSHEDGDGVAPTRSLSLCAKWKGVNKAKEVSVHSFSKVGHGGPLHSKEAIQKFSEIVYSLYKPTLIV